MSKLRLCIDFVDVHVLIAIQAALEFVVEWLGCRRRSLERAFVVGYFVCAFGDNVATGSSRWWLLFYFFVSAVLWIEANDSDQQRLVRMLSPGEACWRVLLLLLTLNDVVASAVLAPHRWFDVFAPLRMACFTLFVYTMSLPSSGEPGRRRKLALAKLKEMFGTSWMPQPEGSAS